MSESALLLLRMVGSLVLVGGLGWALTKVARSRGLGKPAQDLIDVLGQRGLSRNASLILVKVGSKNLLLGVADSGVRVLSEGEDLVTPPAGDHASPGIERHSGKRSPSDSAPELPVGAGASGGVLDRLRDRTVRKR